MDAADARELLRREGVEMDPSGRAAAWCRYRFTDWAESDAPQPVAEPARAAMAAGQDEPAPRAATRPIVLEQRSGNHLSDAAIQRSAEAVILAKVAEHFGVDLSPKRLVFPSGAQVEVDGASSDNSILVEVFARQGALKGGQQKKVCQDALKLITLG